MNDLASPLIASALFAFFFFPGFVVEILGKDRPVGFMNMKTSIPFILFLFVTYALHLMLFFIVLDIHVYVQEACNSLMNLKLHCF